VSTGLRRLTARLARARRYALRSGERQVATTAAAIRADHRQRYELAADVLARLLPSPPIPVGLDLFCGTGYGTDLLSARLGGPVVGIDGSGPAIRLARRRFATPHATFAVHRFPCALPRRVFDYVVCFESLEHVDQDRELLSALSDALRPGGWLWLSTPDQDRLPLDRFPNPFHRRHYRQRELVEELARPRGLMLERSYGQELYRVGPGDRLTELPAHLTRPTEGAAGQTRISLFRRR